MEKYISDLIDRMTKIEPNVTSSRSSISWLAHREAETLSDVAYLTILKDYVLHHSGKDYTGTRRSAYFIMGKILSKKYVFEYYNFLVSQLDREEDKGLITNILDVISETKIPVEEKINISSIIAMTKDNNRKVRCAAIGALRAFPYDEARLCIRYYLEQEDEKTYKYEIINANSTMNQIGTTEDIRYLERHSASRCRDIKISASLAIEQILSRSR